MRLSKMGSVAVLFVFAFLLAISKATPAGVPTCYISIAGAKGFFLLAPYAPGKWKVVVDDGTWGKGWNEWSLEVVADKVIMKNGNIEAYAGSYFPYDAPKNCISQSEMKKADGTSDSAYTYAIAQFESPTIRVKKGGKLVGSNGYFTRVKLEDFSKIFTGSHYNPKVNAGNQQNPGFYWDYLNKWLYVVMPSESLDVEQQAQQYLHYYGIFQKPNEFLLPGVYGTRKLLGKVDSGKACIKLAKRSLSPALKFIKAISYNIETQRCYYCNMDGDTRINDPDAKFTSAAVNYTSVPTCYINIAGAKKFFLFAPKSFQSFFAPYGFHMWKEVKDDGTWGNWSLEAVADKVIMKNGNTEPLPGLSFPYDASKNCISPSLFKKDDLYTYAIVQYESPTIRLKKGGKLVSSEGYFPLIRLNDFSKIFTDGHYNPNANADNQHSPGFYYDYYGSYLYVMKPGGTLEIEPSSGAGKYGWPLLHFYAIYEKANEFLLPGAYKEKKFLGKVDSGKACIELAKKSLSPDLKFIKGISYNVETKYCCASNKDGDARNIDDPNWTSAAFMLTGQ